MPSSDPPIPGAAEPEPPWVIAVLVAVVMLLFVSWFRARRDPHDGGDHDRDAGGDS